MKKEFLYEKKVKREQTFCVRMHLGKYILFFTHANPQVIITFMLYCFDPSSLLRICSMIDPNPDFLPHKIK